MNRHLPALHPAPLEATAGRTGLLRRVSALSAALMRRRGAVLGLSLASLVGIALADILTGYELALSLLYLGPVVASTWACGIRSGLALSGLATFAWLGTDVIAEHQYSLAVYRYWEGFIRLATFCLFAVVVDQLQRALARSDERLIKVLEGLDAAVCVIDPAVGALLYRNRTFDAAFPAEARERAAQHFHDAVLGVASSDQSGVELQMEDRWFLVSGRWLSWTDGRSVLLLSATDVTGRRRAEALNREQRARMHTTARMVAVGEIASSIAHELNQPLAAIGNYVLGCLRRLRAGGADPQALAGALEQAGEQAERAGQIIRRVRDFVQARKPVLTAEDLNALVARATAAAAHEAERSGLRIALHLAAGLPPARADAVMIEQVILNLVRNAWDAVQDPNRPDHPVDALVDVIVDVIVDVTTSRGEHDALVVTIADRGTGVSAEVAARLFEPFYTSKPEGMGLGLNICRSIVEYHDGRLWMTPREGGGAEFHFTLRAARAGA